jgi:Ca-activated chloride channel family protein
MRKTVVFLFAIFMAALSTVHAQTPPGQGDNSQKNPSPKTLPGNPKRPPVLGGATSSPQSSQPTPQTSPSPDESEEAGDGDVVRVNTTLVTVPVSVMDRNGRFIPNLRKDDFHIYEDGVEQQVAYFAPVEKPFTVVLMIDTSGSTQFKMEDIQSAAIAFVDQLRPDDRVMVVSFDDEINVLAEPTSNRAELRRAIRQAEPGDGTRLYDAVDFVMNSRLNHIEGRKAIVLFSDGVDTTSSGSTLESNLRDAEELDALIYTVQYDTFEDVNSSRGGGNIPLPPMARIPNSPIDEIFNQMMDQMNKLGGRGVNGGPGLTREDYQRADKYLGDLSARTGARLQRADDLKNVSQAFAVIAEELRRQYSLGYYPKTKAQAGQRRQVKVRVNQPNLVVRARDSYINNNSPEAPSQQGDTTQPTKPALRPGKTSLSE